MSEARAQSLFSIVRQSADADTVAAMEALVGTLPITSFAASTSSISRPSAA